MTKPIINSGIKRMLICCRGEIAVRIIKTAKEKGITTVLACSEVDMDSMGARLSDEKVCIGGAHASKSYLNQQAIVDAAINANVDAIHPGYGFLSENADFVKLIEDSGIIFIGPSSNVISQMGDKSQAIETAIKSGVPVVPGSNGIIQSLDEAIAFANKIGYPIFIKATAGGGGKGIRIANDQDSLKEELNLAQAEAGATFGNAGVYLEHYIPNAKHIEVQIVGDGENVVHFYERDCSIQRRRQKIWEEAPALCLDDDTRQHICMAAVDLAKVVKYKGAGTVEFLYDLDSKEFYFIEMNTRIQVEHPITEQICQVDLIGLMIDIAAGKPLQITQKDIKYSGHAIEVRINAEDSSNNFMPNPGKIDTFILPKGDGIRMDTMLYEGCNISPFYDSLLGKLIVWTPSRDESLRLLDSALTDLQIDPIKTTASFFHRLLQNQDVINNKTTTTWLESEMFNK